MHISRLSDRRFFLAALAAAGVLPEVTRAQAAAQPSAEGETASVAAGTHADRLTIEVSINGKGPFRFIVDTGAESSVVSTEAAAELALPAGPRVIVDGLARRIDADTAHVTELGFGPFRRRDLLVPLLPRGMMGCDGYLGLDVIEGTRVTFNFAGRVLTVEQPYTSAFRNRHRLRDAKVQMAGRAGYLRTSECWIDGVAATAFVDTGAEVSMGNPPLMAALRRKRRISNDLNPIVLTGVTGGEVVGHAVPVSRIHLQDLIFTDSLLAVVDVPNFTSWAVADKPALLIGMNFLRQFASVAIDYRSGEIRFELASLTRDQRQFV